MGFNCAIYVDGPTRDAHGDFVDDLHDDGVLDDVRTISFTDDETLRIVEYEGAEFLCRYGEFPPAEQSEPNLWFLFEFETTPDSERFCTLETFERLADELPKLQRLRTDISSTTGAETGGGIYGREGAYDPWGLDSESVTGPLDREFGGRN